VGEEPHRCLRPGGAWRPADCGRTRRPEKHELVRRAYYDLTGLPPSPEDVEAFLADPAPDAYEALIDRLLASPRYGEKWGRHWLDLVRFAETNSYERDNPKPNAWRYRDYVIRSFNGDKPFDRFVREQLAGDELPGPRRRCADRHRLLPPRDLGRRADRPRAGPLRRPGRHRRDDQPGLPGADGRLRPLPRPQDRPDPAEGLLPPASFFHNINPYRNGGPTDEVPLFSDPGSREAYESRVREREQRRDEIQAALRRDRGRVPCAVRAGLRRPVRVADIDELRYRFYRDTWDRLPEFDALKPEDTGTLPRRGSSTWVLGPATTPSASSSRGCWSCPGTGRIGSTWTPTTAPA
jgi:hypothetical protein